MKLKLTAIAALLIMLGACKKSDTINTPLSTVANKVVVKYNATDSNYSTMAWDASHRLTQLGQTNVASGTTNTATLTFTRNGSGIITSWSTSVMGATLSTVVHSNGSGQYTDRVYYYMGFAYDSTAFTYTGSRITQAIEYQSSGFGYSPTYRTLYTYDASGNLTSQELYTYSGSWNLDERRSYTYDSMVNPIPFTNEMLLSGAVGFGSDNVIGVGPNNPLTFIDENISGGTTKTTTYVYTYNSNNVPVSAMGTASPGGATTTTTYTY